MTQQRVLLTVQRSDQPFPPDNYRPDNRPDNQPDNYRPDRRPDNYPEPPYIPGVQIPGEVFKVPIATKAELKCTVYGMFILTNSKVFFKLF